MFYSDMAWVNLGGYKGSQSNRYWSRDNHAAHEVPMHDLKVGVWGTISAWGFIFSLNKL
jgi:hypothetical protein